MFPPGSRKAGDEPRADWIATVVMTMGIVPVSCLAARIADWTRRHDDIDLRRELGQPQSRGRRSTFPSAYRYSMTMFFPST